MTRSVRIETAHNGRVRVTWTREGLEVSVSDEVTAVDDGSETKIGERCELCSKGKGCDHAKWAGPAPSWFASRGGKAKNSDEVDPVGCRTRK